MNLLRLCLPLVLALAAASAKGAGGDAAKWADAAALEAARFGAVHFLESGGNRRTAFVYRATAFDPVSGPIWFVMHGAGRSAERYLQAAAPVA